MMRACDERSSAQSCECEEPKESPSDCRIIVYGGRRALDAITEKIKEPIYEYNSLISVTGYYLKPVHKAYKRLPDGRTKIYEYYGRYWWKRRDGRFIYAGRVKPGAVGLDPPVHPLEGLSVLVLGDDIVVSCQDYERFKEHFAGLRHEKYP